NSLQCDICIQMINSVDFLFKKTMQRVLNSIIFLFRYLMRLKEDDEACREALKSGKVLLYHKLSPLLILHIHFYNCIPISLDLEQIFEKIGKDKHIVNESFLLGCTDKNEPQFSLEVDRSALEHECRGMFVDLRKAFFMIPGPESPLAGPALLRWHQTNCFCSATGQPTVRNQSGGFRVCHSSGITYYPKMAPVVIVLVSDGSRCLLACQAMFPPGMYSCIIYMMYLYIIVLHLYGLIIN
uniref:Nudix (nucleoside diphosphate linked moiety X)-type motif 13 n=1 Tax=Sinocyclocheilus anshuiensis TaxID=1608454 RepID=A0A671PS39_9TELE